MDGSMYEGDYQTELNIKIEALCLVVSEKIIFSHCKSMGAIGCHGNHNFDILARSDDTSS